MGVAWGVSAVLVIITIAIHYRAIQLAAYVLSKERLARSVQALSLILFMFIAHVVEIWLFSAGIYVVTEVFGLGELRGEFDGSLRDIFYFSSTSYTSLGLGDIFPEGPIQIVIGLEALTGLIMITWTASFTYLWMQRHWRFSHTSKAAP